MGFPWRDIVHQAVRQWRTPFHVVAWQPVERAVAELDPLSGVGVRVRHWFSVKTQPVKPLLVSWRRILGFGAEVVSLYELMAAMAAGYDVDEIVVNGPGKHAWLPKEISGLIVHLDSVQEILGIGYDQLRKLRIGIRCHVEDEYDPDDEAFGAQFGMAQDDLLRAVEMLRKQDIEIDGMHFHLRSNVRNPAAYGRSLRQILEMARNVGIHPRYIDCGGGLPAPGEAVLENGHFVSEQMNIAKLGENLKRALMGFPSVEELWFENGKFITSRAAIFVVRIIDIKERPECRYLICDGGRTNHALPSDWQQNPLCPLNEKSGVEALTTVCGPSCMAYDNLGRFFLPIDLRIGDHLVWFNAGAYHIPWETRFSRGLSNVIWCDENMHLSLAREEESFEKWWGLWL